MRRSAGTVLALALAFAFHVQASDPAAGEPVARELDAEEIVPALFDVASGIVYRSPGAMDLLLEDGSGVTANDVAVVLVAPPGTTLAQFLDAASAQPPLTGDRPWFAMVSMEAGEVLYSQLANCGRDTLANGIVCLVPDDGGSFHLSRADAPDTLRLSSIGGFSVSDDPLSGGEAESLRLAAPQGAPLVLDLPLFTY
ncbi:MAG: hypothetical protein KDJ68_03405 [Rhodobiaceae bacterium]|nr:hypothetical protein [Rhodobiaceae bacterium]